MIFIFSPPSLLAYSSLLVYLGDQGTTILQPVCSSKLATTIPKDLPLSYFSSILKWRAYVLLCMQQYCNTVQSLQISFNIQNDSARFIFKDFVITYQTVSISLKLILTRLVNSFVLSQNKQKCYILRNILLRKCCSILC